MKEDFLIHNAIQYFYDVYVEHEGGSNIKENKDKEKEKLNL